MKKCSLITRKDYRIRAQNPRYVTENTRKADRNWLRCIEAGDEKAAARHEKIGAIFARLERG